MWQPDEEIADVKKAILIHNQAEDEKRREHKRERDLARRNRRALLGVETKAIGTEKKSGSPRIDIIYAAAV